MLTSLLTIAAVLAVILMAAYAAPLGATLRATPAPASAELTSDEAHAIAIVLGESGNARTVAAAIKLRAER